MSKSEYVNYYPVSVPPEKVDFRISLRGAGQELRTDRAAYRPRGKRTADYLIWQYTISGCGQISYAGQSHQLPPGSALLMPAEKDFSYSISDRAKYWEFRFLDISGGEAIRLVNAHLEHHCPVIVDSADGKLGRLTEILGENCREHHFTDGFAVSSAIYHFLMEVLSVGSCRDGGAAPFRAAVVSYLLTHLAEPLSVSDMARAAGLSRWYFSRRFFELEGVSPSDFLLALRLDQAKKLLANTHLSIKEIAYRCGFAEASYFCRVFRREVGATPSRYRTAERQF